MSNITTPKLTLKNELGNRNSSLSQFYCFLRTFFRKLSFQKRRISYVALPFESGGLKFFILGME